MELNFVMMKRCSRFSLVIVPLLLSTNAHTQTLPIHIQSTSDLTDSEFQTFRPSNASFQLYVSALDYWLEHRYVQRHSDSDGLTLLGEWRYGPCLAIAVLDSHHVLLGNGELLQVLDVSTGTTPQITSEAPTAGVVFDIAIGGHYAYVISNGGLDVVDLSDVRNPEIVGTWSDSTYYTSVVTDIRDVPYIYLGGDDFSVLDVSKQTEPRLVVREPVFRFMGDMQAYMDQAQRVYLYAPNSEGVWVETFDITDPTAPLHTAFNLLSAGNMAVKGDTLLVAGGKSVRILSLAEPLSPEKIGQFELPASSLDFWIEEEILYASVTELYGDTLVGVMTLDISNVTNPRILGNVEWSGPISGGIGPGRIAVMGEQVYAASTVALWGIDAADLAEPRERFYFPTSYYRSRRLVCDGDYLYVAAEFGGLWILDKSEPTQLVPVGHFVTYGSAFDLAVQDTLVLIAVGQDLLVVNVSRPSEPQLISTVTELGRFLPFPGRMDVSNEYAYVPGEFGLVVIDFHQPEQPQIVSLFSLDHVSQVSVEGDLAFLARAFHTGLHKNGLHIIDVTNPIFPKPISTFNLWKAVFVDISGSHAFVATSNSPGLPGYRGFAILDISNPESPIELSRIDSLWSSVGELANGLVVSESWAYRKKVISVINPEAPVAKESIAGFSDVAVCGFDGGRDVICVDSAPGVRVYRNDILITNVAENDRQSPNDFILYQNYPNPFNSDTKIRYQLAAAVKVRLSVYNLVGQKIRTLVNSKQQAGNYSITWDGRDDAGNPVASGLYFYRFESEKLVKTSKMLLLR